VTTGLSPSGRFDYSLMFDPARNRVLLFGGASRHNRTDDLPVDRGDLWALSLDSLRWTPIAFNVGPGPRRKTALMLDTARDRLLLVGGRTSIFRGTLTLFDGWSLPLGSSPPAWTPLGADVPLGSRYYDWSPTVVLDPIRDRLLAWDGSFGLDALALNAPSAWRPIGMSGDLPTQRIHPGVTFDTQRGQMIMFGGLVYQNALAADLRALRFSRKVAVEVLPRGKNEVPLHHGATVDLAILSAPDFSPDSVIVSTLALAGAHVAADGHTRGYLKHEDLNADGVPDLPLQFPADSLKLSPGTDVAVLLGETPSFEVFAPVPLKFTGRHVGRGRLSTPGDLVTARTLALSVHSPSIGGITIRYSLASTGVPARLEVFDIAGRRVASREVAWSRDGDGTISLGGAGLRPGVFLVRLAQGGQAVVRRVVLVQ
jgi:hypothetical protein